MDYELCDTGQDRPEGRCSLLWRYPHPAGRRGQHQGCVDKLEEYGINYIDTARGYTVSEEYLGAALEAAGTSLSWQPRA